MPNDTLDTSTPELPVKMADIERIEDESENPEVVDKQDARYLREMITSKIFDAATDIGSIVSDLESLLDDERVPEYVQRDAGGLMCEMEDALDQIFDQAREDFKNDRARDQIEKALAKERLFDELSTTARDQQHALQEYRDQIAVLAPRAESLKRKCETLKGRVGRMKAEVEAFRPFT